MTKKTKHINLLKILATSVIGFLFCFMGHAQKIYVKSSGTNENIAIHIKWYTQELYPAEGVNIYRTIAGKNEWQKLNDEPIKKAQQIDPEALKQDESLESYTELVKDTPLDEIKGMLLMSILVKSIQSADFARFLGIQYDDYQVLKDSIYQYKVMKIKGTDEELLATSENIKAGHSYPALPPKEISITEGDQTVSITWAPEEERYYGVNIYRKSTSDSSEIKVNDMPLMISKVQKPNGNMEYPDIFYTDEDLQNGIQYSYRLSVLDFFGKEGQLSDRIIISPADKTPPRAPEALHLESNKYEVSLTWKYKGKDEDMIGYHIYRSQDVDTNFQQVNNEIITEEINEYTDVLNKHGNYYYRVSSVDQSGNESFSNESFIEIRDFTPPSRPQKLKATADVGRINLKWDANKEPDLLGYMVQRRLKDATKKDFTLITSKPIKEINYTDMISKNVKNQFVYRVLAIDTVYNKSNPSDIVEARMPDVTAPIRPYIRNIRQTNEGLVIEWVANIETDLVGYNLYKQNEDVEKPEKVNQKIIFPELSSLLDANIITNKSYMYTLTAVDEDGNESEPSEPFKASLIAYHNDELSIENVQVKFNKTKKLNNLRWEVKSSNAPIGSIVYRKTDNGSLKPITSMISKKEFKDKNIKEHTIYYYEVRSYFESGDVVKSALTMAETGAFIIMAE
jgi:hypothetical protein